MDVNIDKNEFFENKIKISQLGNDIEIGEKKLLKIKKKQLESQKKILGNTPIGKKLDKDFKNDYEKLGNLRKRVDLDLLNNFYDEISKSNLEKKEISIVEDIIRIATSYENEENELEGKKSEIDELITNIEIFIEPFIEKLGLKENNFNNENQLKKAYDKIKKNKKMNNEQKELLRKLKNFLNIENIILKVSTLNLCGKKSQDIETKLSQISNKTDILFLQGNLYTKDELQNFLQDFNFLVKKNTKKYEINKITKEFIYESNVIISKYPLTIKSSIGYPSVEISANSKEGELLFKIAGKKKNKNEVYDTFLKEGFNNIIYATIDLGQTNFQFLCTELQDNFKTFKDKKLNKTLIDITKIIKENQIKLIQEVSSEPENYIDPDISDINYTLIGGDFHLSSNNSLLNVLSNQYEFPETKFKSSNLFFYSKNINIKKIVNITQNIKYDGGNLKPAIRIEFELKEELPQPSKTSPFTNISLQEEAIGEGQQKPIIIGKSLNNTKIKNNNNNNDNNNDDNISNEELNNNNNEFIKNENKIKKKRKSDQNEKLGKIRNFSTQAKNIAKKMKQKLKNNLKKNKLKSALFDPCSQTDFLPCVKLGTSDIVKIIDKLDNEKIKSNSDNSNSDNSNSDNKNKMNITKEYNIFIQLLKNTDFEYYRKFDELKNINYIGEIAKKLLELKKWINKLIKLKNNDQKLFKNKVTDIENVIQFYEKSNKTNKLNLSKNNFNKEINKLDKLINLSKKIDNFSKKSKKNDLDLLVNFYNFFINSLRKINLDQYKKLSSDIGSNKLLKSLSDLRNIIEQLITLKSEKEEIFLEKTYEKLSEIIYFLQNVKNKKLKDNTNIQNHLGNINNLVSIGKEIIKDYRTAENEKKKRMRVASAIAYIMRLFVIGEEKSLDKLKKALLLKGMSLNKILKRMTIFLQKSANEF